MAAVRTIDQFAAQAREDPHVRDPSVVYRVPMAPAGVRRGPNRITVVEEDTFDVAQRLQNPLVLNMASEIKPGGGWQRGPLAQEECMFLRSTYALTLSARSIRYPLMDNQVVYSPHVRVFMDHGFKTLDQPFVVACVAAPAVRNPKTSQEGRLFKGDAELTEAKIRAVLELAVVHGHPSVVLGALGCGAFHNPPQHVAEIFLKVLTELQYGLEVVFAVMSVQNRRNYFTFSRVFAAEK